MFERLATLTGSESGEPTGCGCRATVGGSTLSVDASSCSAGGALSDSEACRATVVEALIERDVASIRSTRAGLARDYRAGGPVLFGAAGRFAAAVEGDDPRLADRARRDPLATAREAVGRAGPIAAVAHDAGLATFASDRDYEEVLRPVVGQAIGEWRVDPAPPSGSELVARRTLATGATVRIYDPPASGTRTYHLEPVELGFGRDELRALADAYECLAAGPVGGGDRTPARAVRAVAGDDVSTADVARVLRKHCRESGLLRDLFADPELSDVFVTAPVEENPLRVRVDGETFATNVFLTTDGVAALASRFRRESGRGFSRARPTLDAATTIGDRRVRVAGVTEPVSDGEAFAFRAHDRAAWTLPALVGNDTISPEAAALLSVGAERGAATLFAGPRGSGKTTMLGAVLWEIPPAVRTVLIEDAPELPVEQLQAAGRDAQALRVEDDGTLGPVGALRAALRLGDGALVVGEVRGEEAGVLYEAMRVGASSEAVLGTIHGDGGDEVFERVVSDLGVPPSAFATTDLIVSLETAAGEDGPRRRVRAIEEVVPASPVEFAPLFERTGDGLEPTGRIDRGNSSVVAALTPPEETYADTRRAIAKRSEALATLARTGRTDPSAVTTAQARRRR